jgi:hypothetical protein
MESYLWFCECLLLKETFDAVMVKYYTKGQKKELGPSIGIFINLDV